MDTTLIMQCLALSLRPHWSRILQWIAMTILFSVAPTISIAQPTDQIQQGLSGPTISVSVNEQSQLGLVKVIAPGNCSGVLLTNVWVLTAGHCIDAITGRPTQIITAFSAGVFNVDAIYKFGVGALDASGGIDIGLLRLTSPIPINGSTNSFFTRLYRDDAVGKTVTIYGRIYQPQPGDYSKADMSVRGSADDGRNLMLQSNQGTTTIQGDSGGPTFINEGGQSYLVGITSATGGKIVAIAPHVNWLIAATRSFLDQSQPFASTDAMVDEITSLPEGDLKEGALLFPTANWARAQRKVQWMCTKRGFIGGVFLPRSGPVVNQYRFACIGRSGGIWLDASQSDIEATNWGFQDINVIGWAQASRAAMGICQSRSPGSVGGFFTGFMLTPPNDPGQRMGVICINQQAGELSVAQNIYWPLSGQSDLNAIDWIGPDADATSICLAGGFIGGFATGQQVSDKRGLTCIGRKSVEFSGFSLDTPPDVLKTKRALYAVSLDDPLVAPPNAAIDIPLTFENCWSIVRLVKGCPVAPPYEQWGYDNSTHRLIHVPSGKCLNISGARRDAGAPIILFPCSGSVNEKWTVIAPAGSMEWTVKSDFNSFCLHALQSSGHGSGSKLGQNIASTPTLVQMPCDGSTAQRFSSVDADWSRRNGPH